MLNVGGFGHSGNTALVDFLADCSGACPVAAKYGESAIIRGRWGINGAWQSIASRGKRLEPEFLLDGLLGVERDSHENATKPVVHDFKRNANVVSLLGDGYRREVEQFVSDYESIINKRGSSSIREEEFIRAAKSFVLAVGFLARERTAGIGNVPVFRNDPAAYAPSLLRFAPYTYHIALVRDPRDMAAEWLPYYGHAVSVDGVKMFIAQFKAKIRRFRQELRSLQPQDRERIRVISFEKLVFSRDFRERLATFLGLEPPNMSARFHADISSSNVGIFSALPEPVLDELVRQCMPFYEGLLSDFDVDGL